jgi:hypothetical protein
MKTRNVLIALVGVILLVILGFSLFSNKYVNLIAVTGVKENPQGAVFVSKQPPLMVSLLVNPKQLESITQLLPSNDKSKRVMKSMDKLRTTLLTQAQVDSLDDLKGWIGDEVTFAVTSLDYDHDSNNGTKAGYLLAVKNNNHQLASEFLQTYYSKNVITGESELILDEYQGVKIVYQHPLTENTKVKQVAAAVVGDFVLFANDLPVLTDAINNAQAIELNLDHDLTYQNSIASLPEKKIGVVYVNLPSTSAWITNKPTIKADAKEQSLTLALELNNQGLLTHSALFTGEEENKSPTLNKVPQTLAYVSSESILAIAGANLQLLAENIQSGLEQHNPFAEILAQVINPLESSLDLDFNQEIFAKVTGEYALSFSQNKDNKSLDWFFINQVGEEALSPSFDVMAQSRGLSIGDLPLGDDSMTSWTKLITTSDNSFSRLQAEVKGVHGNINSYEVITNSVNLLSNSLSKSPRNLLSSSTFASSLEILPSNNNGYLYLRWQPLKPYLVKRFPLLRVIELGFKPLFDNLYSITVTNEGVQDGMQMSTIFFDFSLRNE